MESSDRPRPNPRGTLTRRLVILAAALVVALLTAGGLPWSWGFVAAYAAVAFTAYLLLRDRKTSGIIWPGLLGGFTPIAVHFFYGDLYDTISLREVVHLGALAGAAMGVGLLLAEAARTWWWRTHRRASSQTVAD